MINSAAVRAELQAAKLKREAEALIKARKAREADRAKGKTPIKLKRSSTSTSIDFGRPSGSGAGK